MSGYNAARWLLDRHVDAGNGDRVAVRCDGSSTTYTGLLISAWRAQHALRELGVGPGDRVVLIVNDEPAFAAWFLGTMRAGAIPPAAHMVTRPRLRSRRSSSSRMVPIRMAPVAPMG